MSGNPMQKNKMMLTTIINTTVYKRSNFLSSGAVCRARIR